MADTTWQFAGERRTSDRVRKNGEKEKQLAMGHRRLLVYRDCPSYTKSVVMVVCVWPFIYFERPARVAWKNPFIARRQISVSKL